MTHSEPGNQTPNNDALEQKKRAELELNARNGANYFFWIAFFSIFNQIMDMLSTKRRFVFGLGAPLYIERSMAVPDPALTWGIIIVLAAIFVVFGIFARRGNLPIFIIGIVFYLVDLAMSILSGDFAGAAVHVVFTVLLVLGVVATKKLKEMPSA